MTMLQRIVLLIGAICIIVVVVAAPRVQYAANGAVVKSNFMANLANLPDFRSTLLGCLCVLGATVLIWFALTNNKRED